jgi:hypothetical protein
VTDLIKFEKYIIATKYLSPRTPQHCYRRWKAQIPIESVDYSFDVKQFPTLPKDKDLNMDTTCTNIAETLTTVSGWHPATAVSAMTEDFVSTAVRMWMTEFEAEGTTQVADFQSRLDSLNDTIADIHSTVDTISSKMAGAVLKLLTSPDGILTKQDKKLDAQSVTINWFFEMLSTLTTNVKRIGTATKAMADKTTLTSPIHKQHYPGNRDEDFMEHDNPAGLQ